MTAIEDVSEAELGAVLSFLADQQPGNRPPVLIGGWAVFAYSPYSKSIDIDIVLSARHRRTLLKWLRGERGYHLPKLYEEGWRGAYKNVEGVGEIIVDVTTFEETQRFEDRQEELPFRLTLEHNENIRVAGHRVVVPNRSLLLLYKLKAAWDRNARLQSDRSMRPEWETAKLRKDRSDILAMIDPGLKAPWDLGFLSEEFQRCNFLSDVLENAIRDPTALARYGQMSPREAKRALEWLQEATTPGSS